MKKEKIICDCGHIESECSDFTRGYGKDKDGKTFCYDCCHKNDLEEMKTAQKFTAYMSQDGRQLVNWPGRVLGRVSVGNRHPWSRERFYISVVDVHGQKWHGVGAAGMWASIIKNTKQG